MLQLRTPHWGQGTGDSQNSLAGFLVAVNSELYIIRASKFNYLEQNAGVHEIITTAMQRHSSLIL
jgi:hypothetical protein